MTTLFRFRALQVLLAAMVVSAIALPYAHAAGDRLLATGGVTQLEGASGGGLVPWAVIAGYGTRDQVGVTAHHTNIDIDAFRLQSSGVAVGIYDRVELSMTRQLFSLGSTVPGQSIRQDIFGAKVRIAGDAVYDEPTAMPQLAVGLQMKRNRDMLVPRLLGAKSDNGVDIYLSVTKLFLAGLAGRNLLTNLTVRATKANQIGLLGFGGDKNQRYQLQVESSVALFLTDQLALGAEYRTKPDNLRVFKEDNYYDVFVAYFLNKHASLTLAHARLGQIADKRNQRGTYLSLQLAP